MFLRHLMVVCAVLSLVVLQTGSAPAADDLNPVKFHDEPDHPPVKLVVENKPVGKIYVVQEGRSTSRAVRDLQSHIEKSTGAKLPVVKEPGHHPVIVVGQSQAAKDAGLAGEEMPLEGFAIKTGPDSVFIVGRGDAGTAHGIYEFLERFVGVRWYWPEYREERGETGTSIVRRDSLSLDPVHLTDAPRFRKRIRWPSGGPRINDAEMSQHDRRMRCGNTWPINLIVHAPHNWAKYYKEDRPEIFQLRKDGQRDFQMLCYGHPLTLKTYLEEIEYQLNTDERLGRGRSIIKGKAITVSPADMAVSCHDKHCRELWNEDGGHYGSASKVLGTFVAELGREVKKRWPDMTVIFLPYKNYTYAPEGVEFPNNVQVQICGMPGLAQYKDRVIRRRMQQNVDDWVRLTGNRIQNWHYSCWPANRTKAAYLFPHVAQNYYRDNLDKTVGTFINGVSDHWPRQHLSIYVWLKVLWDPDVNVDAIVEEYCRRMYGPASGTMRELVGMLIEGWEDSEWDPHVLSPKTVYQQSFPREDVLKIKGLLEKAYEQAKGNELVTRRLDYYAPSLRAFFAESKLLATGQGIKPLKVYQVAEDPTIDGRLEEKAWQQVEPVHFVNVRTKKEPKYPTQLKAVWTRRGITFGLRMSEPEIDKLKMDIGKGSRDASLMWWNDNVEIFLDPSGKRRGYFQFIVNPRGAIYDSVGRENTEWDAPGAKAASHVGDDFWSVELFVPYDSFQEVVLPGTGVEWHGNFTRHRVTDRKAREYQGFNVTTGAPSHNQNAFGPIRFIER